MSLSFGRPAGVLGAILAAALAMTACSSSASKQHHDHAANTIAIDQPYFLDQADFPDGYTASPISDPHRGWWERKQIEQGATSSPAECHAIMLASIDRALQTPRSGMSFIYRGDPDTKRFSETLIHDPDGLNRQRQDDARCSSGTGVARNGTKSSVQVQMLTPPPVVPAKTATYLLTSVLSTTDDPNAAGGRSATRYVEGYAQVGDIEMHMEQINRIDDPIDQAQFNRLFVKAVEKLARRA